MGVNIGQEFFLSGEINQTDLLAGTPKEVIAPCDGVIEELFTTVQVAVTTGGAVTVKIGTTDVVGLSITVTDGATKGTVQSDKPTLPSKTRNFVKGDRIQIVPAAAFDTAGALNFLLRCTTGKPN